VERPQTNALHDAIIVFAANRASSESMFSGMFTPLIVSVDDEPKNPEHHKHKGSRRKSSR
jgi:hypothetical protein